MKWQNCNHPLKQKQQSLKWGLVCEKGIAVQLTQGPSSCGQGCSYNTALYTASRKLHVLYRYFSYETVFTAQNRCKEQLNGQTVCMSLDGWSKVHNEPVACVALTDPIWTPIITDAIDTSVNPAPPTSLRSILCDWQRSKHEILWRTTRVSWHTAARHTFYIRLPKISGY